MAKNHTFLGLLCIAFICVHFYPACYRVRPDVYLEPGSAIEQIDNNNSANSDNSSQGGHGASAVRKAPISKATAAKIKQVKAIYDSQIGVREKDHNTGKEVESYLAYVNLGKGHPWCAAFICWVFGQGNIPNPKTAWSPSLFPRSRVIWQQSGLKGMHATPLHAPKIPRQGDIFGIYFADKKRIAHAGFVDDWQEKWVTTVEGNTNPEGYRDGDGVYRKKRLKSSLYQVARYIN